MEALHSIQVNAGGTAGTLITMIGYVEIRHTQTSSYYMLNREQFEIYNKLIKNKFRASRHVDNMLIRKSTYYTVQEALAAIERGDIEVDNFLDAVDRA